MRRSAELRMGWLRRDIAWYRSAGSSYRENLRRQLQERKWLFLVGCNNSGTTLLHELLVQSGIFTAMKYEGQRYTRQLRMAEKRGHERVWSEYLSDLRLTESDDTSCVQRLVHDWLYDARPRDRKYFLEKTTANAVRMRWIQTAIPNSFFIGVIRNGYAVCEGIRRKGNKNLSRAAKHWATVNEIMAGDSGMIKNYLQVRYEDMVHKPAETLEVVGHFLGIDAGEFIERIDYGHIRDMNPYSFRLLDDSDRREIEAHAAGTLRSLGYIAE